jgi:CubicO group peptidase (beta-lactamase class C family)
MVAKTWYASGAPHPWRRHAEFGNAEAYHGRTMLPPYSTLVRAACFGLATVAFSATLPEAKTAEEVGLSTERLARIHAMIAKHRDLGDITGAVTLVARKGKIAYVDVQGVMDAETKKPVQRDTVFRIASMTKPVIGVAILMMMEEGKLRIDDPVSKFIPEFKDMKVAVESEPGGAAARPPKFDRVSAARAITIKDLLTHTSGLASGPMGASEVAKVSRKPHETLAEYIPRLGGTVLEFQPGCGV